jgi:hypothetical protein
VTASPAFEIRLGTFPVRRGVTSVSETIVDHATQLDVEIAAEALLDGPADYRSHAASTIPDYRGKVLDAVVAGDRVRLRMSTGAKLSEGWIEHLSARVSNEELVWSVAQIAGLHADEHTIEGFRRIPSTFAVAVPVHGLSSEVTRSIGSVMISGEPGIANYAGDHPDSPTRGRFMEAKAWAIVEVEADTAYGAELAAIPMIEMALDRLAVEGQYSLAWDPDRVLIPFHRDAVFANPRASAIVSLRERRVAGRPQRTWLRDRSEPVRFPPIRRTRVVLDGPTAGRVPVFDEAIRAWRRAVTTSDAIAAVGALFEAIEFYIHGVVTKLRFAEHELSAIDTAVGALPLTEEQRKRLAEVIAFANEPPLFERLRQALETDGVPFTGGELEALRRLRRFRNQALHGKSRERPSDNDLEIARALVNRVLVFWARAPRMAGAPGAG